MKKLLIAMSAAAMFSLGAQAAKVSLVTGTDFDNYASAWDPQQDDNGQTSGTVYWTGGGGDSSIKVKEEGGSDKYLWIDETEALARQIKIDEHNAVVTQTVSSAGGVYFSSKVQFTAADDAPEVGKDGDNNIIDKIIVWAKAPDDGAPAGTTTNLMVTALDLSGSDNHEAQDYNEGYGNPKVYDTGVAITADTWYTLDIVAAAQDGDSPIAFTVSLNGNDVGTYNSMVIASTSGATTISSASFKGTGAVDDIDWGTVTVEPVGEFKFFVNVDDQVLGLGSATYSVDGGAGVPISGNTTNDVSCSAKEIVVTAFVYNDCKVTTPNAVKGAVATIDDDDDAFVWTITNSVANTEAGAVVGIDLVIEKDGGSGGDEPTITPSKGEDTIDITAASAEAAKAAAIVAIQAPADVDADTYRGYFTAAAVQKSEGVYTVTLALDPDEVTPVIDGDDEDLDIAGGKIAVKTKPGLFYQLLRGTVPTTIETTVAELQADAAAEVLTDANPPEDKAFYKVTVTADQQIKEN